MTAKRIAIVVFLGCVSVSVFGQLSTLYPEKKGVVSDYADKLSNSQVEELSAIILDYERRTSIEIAVVVVDDLHGRSARNYAIGLGDEWGVGKAGRNNGIVLLWAPNQRAYSLRIAGGLSEDLSDSDAAQITQEYLLPNFKSERYYDGLKATVLATTAHLGNLSWEQRLQRRAQTAAERSTETNEGIAIAGGVVLFLSIVVLVVVGGRKWKQRQKKLAELARAGDEIAGDLEKAERNAWKIRQLLDDFAKEAPEQDLAKLRSNLARQPERIAAIRGDTSFLDFGKSESYERMIEIRTSAETEADLLESVQQSIANIRTSKQRSQSLLDRLSKESFAISEVQDNSRRSEVDELLARSRNDYEQARGDSCMSIVDWILIYERLNRCDCSMRDAIRCSQKEPYIDVNATAFTSEVSTATSVDSSSFGGGGGFSSGSGSDGTY